MTITSTLKIINEIKLGKMIILVDEEERENEGDLMIAADFITPKIINFMTIYGRGLICLTLTEKRCKQLNIPLMTYYNKSKYKTAFTVSIEAAKGITTGISASDRARTIMTAISKNSSQMDIVQPGHVFPIMANPKGVLGRPGHTEAGCDLAMLAGLTPASVICEIIKEDGTMARLKDLYLFSKIHKIKIGTIKDLIYYRSRTESIIFRISEHIMNTDYGKFNVIMYKDYPTNSIHIALVHGDINPHINIIVKLYETFSIIDILNINKYNQLNLRNEIKEISIHGKGIIILLNCCDTQKNIINKFNKIFHKKNEKKLKDTIDFKKYGIGAQILLELGVKNIQITSCQKKLIGMNGYKLKITNIENI